MLTDVYSYGLVFAELALGFAIHRHLQNTGKLHEFAARKLEDNFNEYVENMLHQADRNGLRGGDWDDPELITDVLNATLQKDANKRNLHDVILILSLVPVPSLHEQAESVLERCRKRPLAVPYQALEESSGTVKDQVVRSLHWLAECYNDSRRAAACFELAVCYASGFGTDATGEKGHALRGKNAMKWAAESARAGDERARLSLYPLAKTFAIDFPQDIALDQWLVELAEKGSSTALRQLRCRNARLYDEALCCFRNLYFLDDDNLATVFQCSIEESTVLDKGLNDRGDTFMHYWATTGNIDNFRGIPEACHGTTNFNAVNNFGETPLLCAVRAGHHEIAQFLVARDCSANISNYLRENPLHFVSSINDQEVAMITRLLMDARARINERASGSSFPSRQDTFPLVGGSPVLRAVMTNSPMAAMALLDLEDEWISNGRLLPQFATRGSRLRNLLAYAVRLHHTSVLRVLERRFQEDDVACIDDIKFWDNGKLTSLSAFCVRGGVSINPASGEDWPEKFWRIMRSDGAPEAALDDCLELLSKWGVDFQKHECGGESNALVLATRLGRRDAVSWLLNALTLTNTKIPAAMWLSESELQLDVASLRTKRFCLCESYERPATPGVGNGEDGVMATTHFLNIGLVEVIQICINSGQRGVFFDLLRYANGCALNRGKSCLVACLKFFGNQAKNGKSLSTLRELLSRHPERNVSCFFPGISSHCGAILFPDERKQVLEHKECWETFDGTLNYPLLFLSLIVRSPCKDIALSHILFDAMREAGDQPDKYCWVATRLDNTSLNAMLIGKEMTISPLWIAIDSDWEDMIRLLLENGASPQDMVFHAAATPTEPVQHVSSDEATSDKYSFVIDGPVKSKTLPTRPRTILQTYLKHSSQNVIEYGLERILRICGEKSVERIIVVDDIETLLGTADKFNVERWRKESCVSWNSDGLLVWTRESRLEESRWLWEAIIDADNIQKHQMSSPSAMVRSSAITSATLQHHFYALRALLRMNFDPRGIAYTSQTAELDVPDFRDWFIDDRPLRITPWDIAFWTSKVPDDQCSLSGKALKKQNQKNAELLREHDRTIRGQEYSIRAQVRNMPLLRSAKLQKWVVRHICISVSLVGFVIFLQWSFGLVSVGACFDRNYDDEPDIAFKKAITTAWVTCTMTFIVTYCTLTFTELTLIDDEEIEEMRYRIFPLFLIAYSIIALVLQCWTFVLSQGLIASFVLLFCFPLSLITRVVVNSLSTVPVRMQMIAEGLHGGRFDVVENLMYDDAGDEPVMAFKLYWKAVQWCQLVRLWWHRKEVEDEFAFEDEVEVERNDDGWQNLQTMTVSEGSGEGAEDLAFLVEEDEEDFHLRARNRRQWDRRFHNATNVVGRALKKMLPLLVMPFRLAFEGCDIVSREVLRVRRQREERRLLTELVGGNV